MNPEFRLFFRAACCLWLFCSVQGFGYDEPEVTAGPLTVRIQEPMLGAYGSGGILQITQPEMPVPIVVSISNSSDVEVRGTVRIQVIDRWRIEPSTPQPFSVNGNGRRGVTFTAYPGEGTFNAHYPVRALVEFDWRGARLTADPVRILTTQFPNPPRAGVAPPAVLELPAQGAIALWRTPAHRERLVASSDPAVGPSAYEPRQLAPVVRFGDWAERGARRMAIRMVLGPRPPGMAERIESAATEFPLALPDASPIRLTFGAALGEGAGQVEFRALAAPLSSAGGEQLQVLWSRQVTGRTWQEHEVDLSRFAGRRIRLVLEAELLGEAPGEALWGEPTVICGNVGEPAPFPPAASEEFRSLGRAGDFDVRLWLGQRGLLDASVGFVSPTQQLMFHGFRVGVLDDSLNDWRSVAELVEAREEPVSGRIRVRHRFRSWAGPFDLLTELWTERGVLRARFWLENRPEPKPWLDVHLQSVMAGSWSERARRVYAGVGNVVEEPKAFRMSFDGHTMASSFVGFEFANGISLVQGVDAPPTGLEVDPAERVYSLNTPHTQTLTFIPGGTVWEGVRTWRSVNGLEAAPGVPDLAGRFVFDLWGFETAYADGAAGLAKAFRYGLTDAAVVWHNWQRWGYDYRLPDIWPPNPEGGSLENFVSLARICDENGVLFAPHDNYIDFYPDAEGFSYDHVAFRRDGSPHKAWFMGMRKAQSYRWRPDRVLPILQRNVRLIRDGLSPSAYFIDVWSSIGPYDYWTSDGQFRDRLSTRQVWGEAFAWIRDFLGGAPQISEAGHDQLIGWLDGAQANHLRIDSERRSFVITVDCRDSERIPWLDAAHHDRFILHGAGYPGRYEAGLDSAAHGIYSDDYITTEVLTGHPAMVDTAFSRDVVRKYWLLAGLMRALAMRRIEEVRFDGDDIHRQQVTWDNGQVWVNRGRAEWNVEGTRLPQYGFLARAGDTEAAIELRGSVTEWSRSPSMLYLNGRGSDITMNGVSTSGGVRLTREGAGLLLTPLPESPAFAVQLAWSELPWELPPASQVDAVGADGSVLSSSPVRTAGGRFVIDCEPGVFAYRLR